MVLELTGIGRVQRYQVRTTTAVQVAQMKFENELLYVVEQRLLGKNAQGYILQIDIVHSTQKADDIFSRALADVNQASRQLVLQTDVHGRLLRVENQAAVRHQWEQMRRAVQAKYAAEPTVAPFLDAFEQQLAVPGSMEPNLRDKGIHGALLAGIYGLPLGAAPLQSKRQIAGFFNELDLPLLLATTAGAAEPSATTETVPVFVTGTLDEEQFAATDFRRLMRGIVDDYTYPVALELECAAQHVFEVGTGALVRSQQRLVAEVPGIYLNRITHDLFPQPTA